jgi:hypothetical protein
VRLSAYRSSSNNDELRVTLPPGEPHYSWTREPPVIGLGIPITGCKIISNFAAPIVCDTDPIVVAGSIFLHDECAIRRNMLLPSTHQTRRYRSEVDQVPCYKRYKSDDAILPETPKW